MHVCKTLFKDASHDRNLLACTGGGGGGGCDKTLKLFTKKKKIYIHLNYIISRHPKAINNHSGLLDP